MTALLSLLPPVVAATLEGSYGHHRTPWFEGILEQVAAFLAEPLGAATPLMLTATAAGGREAFVANCTTAGQPVWVQPGGAFAELAAIWSGQPRPLAEWPDGPHAPGALAPLVLLEHVAPSGALLDVGPFVSRIRQQAPDAVVVLDASVSFGADVAELASLGVDGALLAAEGALMGIPGLAIVAAGDRLLDHVRQCREAASERPFYFDLLRYQKAWGKKTTPYSPNISATIALAKALELIAAHGGLARHVAEHASRAASVRAALAAGGHEPVLTDGMATNAFTIVGLPAGCTCADVIAAVEAAEPHVQLEPVEGHGRRLRLAHTGYLPAGSLARAIDALWGSLRRATARGAASDAGSMRAAKQGGHSEPVVADLTLPLSVPTGIPAEAPLPVFEIPASEFQAQAALHARRAKGGAQFEQRIGGAARETFRNPHRYSRRALETRTVGFIGAGNITRHAVEKCLSIGVRNLIVYSPSLAERKRATRPASVQAAHQTVEYWQGRGVVVADSADDVFTRAHTIVLLPWFYDRRALEAFGRGDEYLNEGLVSASVLSRIEREGCADVLINAAARAGFVDRAALRDAVAAGWLRYYSDELPAPDDPLLDLPNARFTGHVGGSCAQPQAAVARNTHRILRQLLTQLTRGGELGADRDYRVNVINAPLDRAVPWRSAGASARDAGAVRVLITDPFDVPSLDFERLRAEVAALEVLDVSADQPGGEALAHHLRTFRPHVLMLRSRTKVDRALALVAAEVPELSAVVRPGVGIDNVYGALQELTRLGVQIINEPFGNSPAVAEMTVHFILSAADETLLAPGPTRFRPDVFAVTDRYEQPARAGFRAAEQSVRERMASWFGTGGDSVVVSGSGTALMEAGIVNLTQPGDRGLVISHGKFGDRFIEIADSRQRVVRALRTDEPEWGRAITPAEVRAIFETCTAQGERIAFLCCQQNETSSGVAYHAPELAELVTAARAHNPDIMVIVDAISGAFAHAFEFDALDVDLVVTGSHKGLGVSSGLAYGAVSQRAVKRMLALAGSTATGRDWTGSADATEIVEAFERRQRVRYLSLLRLLLEQSRESHAETPSVFHVLSTLRALELHDADGGRQAVIARHGGMARMVRDGLAAAGLRPVSHAPFESDSVTPAFVPEGITASELRRQLEGQYGIAIAGAQGDYWKRQMIRIGHLGFVYPHDVARCLRALHVLHRQAARLVESVE